MTRHIDVLLREVRTMQECTQDELASAAGVEQATISRIERGQRMPSLETAWRLARALGVSLDDLVRERSDETIRATTHSRQQLQQSGRPNSGVDCEE